MTDNTPLEQQVDALAALIVEQFPGEPSQWGGAIETAMRLLIGQKQVIAEQKQRISDDSWRLYPESMGR